MKKFLSIMACFALVLVGGIALAACGSKDKEKTPTTMSEAEFLTAIETATAEGGDGIVKLTGDLRLTQTVTVKAEYTLDLNGKTITADGTDYNYDVFDITTGKLTVTGNGTINVTGAAYVFGVYNTAYDGVDKTETSLVIENGSFKTVAATAVHIWYGKVEIKGGTFDADPEDKWNHTYVLNCQDKNIARCSFEVTGGTFVGFNPEDNAAENPKVDFTADGYHAEQIEGTNNFKVVQDQPVEA